MIYCKNFCKCHNEPPAQQKRDLKSRKINQKINLSESQKMLMIIEGDLVKLL
jgi:hypothetical protein